MHMYIYIYIYDIYIYIYIYISQYNKATPIRKEINQKENISLEMIVVFNIKLKQILILTGYLSWFYKQFLS